MFSARSLAVEAATRVMAPELHIPLSGVSYSCPARSERHHSKGDDVHLWLTLPCYQTVHHDDAGTCTDERIDIQFGDNVTVVGREH